MATLKNLLLALVAVLALLVLPACDSGNDNGGGAAPTATGYSNASMAGTWDVSETRYQNGAVVFTGSMKVSFNESGRITAMYGSGCADACGGDSSIRVLSDSLDVNPDGTTYTAAVVQCACWNLMALKRNGKGKLTSPGYAEEKGTLTLYNPNTGTIVWTLQYRCVWKKR